MNGGVDACKNCIALSWVRKSNTVNRIALEGHGFCQFKCSYCQPYFTIKNTENTYKAFVKYYNELKAQNRLSQDFSFSIALGEITANQLADEYLDFIINATKTVPTATQINSNGAIYNEKIAGILQNGGYLIVSVDAGTKETYKTIHGLDVYERVLSNIRKYLPSGCICLKYLFTANGRNANENDIAGFIEFIAEEKPHMVTISYEFDFCGMQTVKKNEISKTVLSYMAILVQKLRGIHQSYNYAGEFISLETQTAIERMSQCMIQ
jgi:pyruvate-formate lyase-activating enzyme